jgi:23S rRNA (uracil1939-C5)-methyltransferase
MPAAVNDVVTLKIDKLVHGGDGLGRLDDLAVFVPRTAPGDVVRARIVSRKKHFLRAELQEILSPSPWRVSPSCPFFAAGCGGCQWLHLDYDAQQRIKTSLVVESIHHALKNDQAEIFELLPMTDPVRHRNKATAKCALGKAGELTLGFFAGRTHRVVDVFSGSGGGCLAQNRANNVFLAACAAALRDYLPWLRRRKVTSIAIRSADGVVSTDLPKYILESGKELLTLAADRVSIRCGGRDFRVSGPSFFQTNTRQAETLLQVVENFLRPDLPGKVLVDLFSGVGLFSLSFAGLFDRVYGIESSTSAVADARFNAGAQGIDNVSWLAGRAEDEFSPLAASVAGLDAVIIDPPREGCDRRLLAQLAASRARKIIYVSCDLATFCRDLRHLAAAGYELDAVQPVDMFPHTAHIETVACLRRNSS